MGRKHTGYSLRDCDWLPLEALTDSTLLITGGTGLVGSQILRELAAIQKDYHIRLLALVRNEDAAKKKFSALGGQVEFLIGDIVEEISVDGPVDYILHGASVTSSKAFVENPVETIQTSVIGTMNMLNLAVRKRVRSMVYLSSMEVYGVSHRKTSLTESDLAYLNPLNLRSSYPESKRMCENLCVAYAGEYGVDVKIARLAQTFGFGADRNDQRVMMQFLRSALKNEPIEIKTSGQSSRMYLHSFDAVTALLSLLLKGEKGEAYNIADKSSYCSIRELASHVVKVTSSESEILINTGDPGETRIYPPDSYLFLDVSKLEALGWKPLISLKDGLFSLAQSMKDLDVDD